MNQPLTVSVNNLKTHSDHLRYNATSVATIELCAQSYSNVLKLVKCITVEWASAAQSPWPTSADPRGKLLISTIDVTAGGVSLATTSPPPHTDLDARAATQKTANKPFIFIEKHSVSIFLSVVIIFFILSDHSEGVS